MESIDAGFSGVFVVSTSRNLQLAEEGSEIKGVFILSCFVPQGLGLF